MARLPLFNEPLDVQLDSNFDLVFDGDIHLTRGLPGVEQNIKIYVSMFVGEWFLNESKGIPYWDQILGTKIDDLSIRQIFRERLLDIYGVVEVRSIELSLDVDRLLTVDYNVRTAFGDLQGLVEVEV